MDHIVPIKHNEDSKIWQDIFKEQNEISLLCCKLFPSSRVIFFIFNNRGSQF